MINFFKKKDSKETDDLENVSKGAYVGSHSVQIGRRSSASQEYVKAYTGVDPATGQKMQKSLSSIAKSKINPNYRSQNIKQQAGYTAEVLEVAEKNAANIMEGKHAGYTRVDDVPGRPVNETAFDITAFDENGREVLSESSQLKFTKSNAKEQAKQLTGRKFRKKYPHGKYTVPAERYGEIKNELVQQQIDLKEKIKYAQKNGNYEAVADFKERLNYTETVERNLHSSEVTTQQAINARMHPKIETAKRVFDKGNAQGIEFAKFNIALEGSISAAKNIYKYMNGEINQSEAASNIASDVASVGVEGYVLGQSSNLLGTALQNSSNSVLKKLGEGSAPVQMLMFVKDTTLLVANMLDGEIDSYECIEGIAKSGTNIAGSAMIGGAIGGPAGFVAAFVSGMIINAALDCGLAEIDKPYLQAKKERKQIEAQCNALRKQLKYYQQEFRNTYESYTNELAEVFGTSIKGMALALHMNDADNFIVNANQITNALGAETQFSNVDEFIDFLDSGEPLEL